MPTGRSSSIKIQPVRKERPDIRALARVLIELALSDASKAKPSETTDPSRDTSPSPGVEPAA